MSDRAAAFVEGLAGLSPGLAVARREAVRGFPPGDLPMPVLLLALGHRLADETAAGGVEGGRALEAIGTALTGDDPDLHTASSGIVEALVGRAVDQGFWADIRPALPDAVAAHALAFVALDR